MPNNKQFGPEDIFIGIDFGMSRIGVACGQMITSTSTPLKTILAKHGAPCWEDLDKVVDEWHPSAFVVGMVSDLFANNKSITKEILKFIKQLQNRYQIPVYEVDEKLTTKAAREMVFEQGGYKSLKKAEIDSIAATLILEEWMSMSL